MNEIYFAQICEALLFSSPNPLSLDTIKGIIDENTDAGLEEKFNYFVHHYNQNKTGLKIIEVAGGYALVTRPEFAHYIRKLKTITKRTRLSRASCEVLAIIAYQQPITVPEIEHIRGVDSSGVIKNLLDKQFVTILGKRHGPGNPLLYGTTQKFLIEFGLPSVSALPSLDEFDIEMKHLKPQQHLSFDHHERSDESNFKLGDDHDK